MVEWIMGDKSYYVEKMPEHILRIEDMLKGFPKAKFIYLKRPWFSVARSIASVPSWYGFSSTKFHALLSTAYSRGYLDDITSLSTTTDSMTRGVIEWYIHSKSLDQALLDHPSSLLVIDYDALCDSEDSFTLEIKKVLEFIELKSHLINAAEIYKKLVRKKEKEAIDTKNIEKLPHEIREYLK